MPPGGSRSPKQAWSVVGWSDGPGAGAVDGALPFGIALVDLGAVGRGLPTPVVVPVRGDGVDVLPDALGEPGEERSTECGGLADCAASHLGSERVGLELAEQVHHARTAVDAQRRDRASARA